MILQRIIFPDTPSEMYMRGGSICDKIISLKNSESLSFDTYYNAFFYTNYRRYTNVSSVNFTISFSGSLSVSLCCFDGKDAIICSRCCSGQSQELTLSVNLAELPEKGFIYPKVTAEEDCIINQGYYSTDCSPRKISACIAICTFKREKYVIKNIERLSSFDFSYINRVFVVDNGKTLATQQFDDSFISVVPNKNYGGSGGFTRGLIEAYDGGYTHVILMDDDVEFHPETLEQMTVFMALLSNDFDDSWFSAAMLPISKDAPYMQYEMGASWIGRKIINSKTGVDIRRKETLLDNMDNDDIQYGAWWCLCMPVSVVEKQGLPYPFFIKFDDVEFGLRKSKNVRVITSNGIAVNHEAFDKKLSMFLEYYMLRNQLILDSLYGYSVFTALRIFLYEAAKNLILYRYDNIQIILRAVNDYMGGVDFFLSCDEEKLNSELIAAAPQLVSLDKIPQWRESMRCDGHKPDKRMDIVTLLTLGGHLIPSFLLDKLVGAVPLSRCGTKECFGKKAMIQYQLEGNNGIYTQRSFIKFVKYSWLTVVKAIQLFFNYGRVRKQFISRKAEITSFEFWRNHLDI